MQLTFMLSNILEKWKVYSASGWVYLGKMVIIVHNLITLELIFKCGTVKS